MQGQSKIFFCLQRKNFPPDKRHPGHRSRYGKYRPRSGYGFLRTACQPIRIENFEKPYNNLQGQSKIFFCLQRKNFPPDKRHRDTGPDTENTDHGPDMGFYGPLVNQSE